MCQRLKENLLRNEKEPSLKNVSKIKRELGLTAGCKPSPKSTSTTLSLSLVDSVIL